MEWYLYVLAILAGFAAGVINTLAGSGSLLTLSMLLFLGLPAPLANGSNRLGILTQTLVSTLTFKRSGKLNLTGATWLIIPSVAGAIAGASVAVQLDQHVLNLIIGCVMLVLLYFVLANTAQWFREDSEENNKQKSFLSLILYFAVGFYGGFLQMGVGIFLLMALLLYSRFSLTHSNAIKNTIVFAYTIPSLAIYVYHGQVDWWMGGLLAIGQTTGGWAAAHFSSRFKHANKGIRWLIIGVLVFTILKTFGVFSLFR